MLFPPITEKIMMPLLVILVGNIWLDIGLCVVEQEEEVWMEWNIFQRFNKHHVTYVNLAARDSYDLSWQPN